MTDKESRTQAALRLMREEGITAYAASKRVGLTTTTVHSAWRRSQGICPGCGRPMSDAKVEHKVTEDRAECVVDPVLVAYRQRLLAAIGQMRQGHRLSDETIKVVDWIEQWIELNQ